MQQSESRAAVPLSNRVFACEPGAVHRLAAHLASHLVSLNAFRDSLLIMCIGTDRSTGDCLGPLVGSLLQERIRDGLRVLGTLDEPVHAGNLADTVRRIEAGGVMLAVDACLGQAEQIGSIAIALGPVKPGAGVNKVLPAVGTLHITGTVNVAGFMEYLVLQNTRLSLVMQMARVISDAIPIGFGLAKSTRSEATCRALEAR